MHHNADKLSPPPTEVGDHPTGILTARACRAFPNRTTRTSTP
jgi:hypothetical protein